MVMKMVMMMMMVMTLMVMQMIMMMVVLTKSAHWLQLNREVPPTPVLTCPLHRVLALRLYSIKTLGEVITINEGNCECTSLIAQIFVLLWILALTTFQSNHRMITENCF